MRKTKIKQWERPSKLKRLEKWRESGLTYPEMAKLIGISPRTFFDWRSKSVAIDNAVKIGTKTIVQELRLSLIKKALGYTRIEQKPFVLVSTRELAGKGKITESRVEMVDVEVYYPPDTNALKFALVNITQTDTESDEDGIVWRMGDRAETESLPANVIIDLRRVISDEHDRRNENQEHLKIPRGE